MERARIEAIAREAGTLYGVPFELIAGVIQTESAWNESAKSSAGASGLMQLMPKTFAWLGFDPSKIMEPTTNIAAGVKYLSQLLANYGGSWALAAMAYNGGPGTVDAAIKRAGSTDPDQVSAQIKAKETREYWGRVLNWAAAFGGQISATQARAQIEVNSVSSNVRTWATTEAGKAIVLLIAAGGLFILMRGIRG
jgi:soluble lytic murein transglycosylase-like protein